MQELHDKIRYLNDGHSERIILTNNCNLKCKYCYQSAKTHSMLSIENINKRIELLKLRLPLVNILRINLFGGEPLLNWNGFKLICDEFRDQEKIYLSTITNGTLLNKDRINYLKQIQNFSLDISMDGNVMGNKWRIMGDNNSFDILLNNLFMLNSYNMNYTIRITLGKFNYDYIFDSLKMFKELGTTKIIIECIVSPMLQEIEHEQFIKLENFIKEIENDNFKIDISINRKISKHNKIESQNGEYKSANCTHNKKPNTINYVTQPNGIVYSHDSSKSLGINDKYAFNIQFDQKIENSSILDMINLNTLEYKIIK